jgi:hypothetical protein
MAMGSGWWWVSTLLLTWGSLFLASGWRAFGLFYSGGLWSVAIAIAIELVIRRHLNFWNADVIVAKLVGVGLVTFAGPRFVEGTLFLQYLPKQSSLQLPIAVVWALAALVSDVLAAVWGYAHLSFQTATASLLSHTLRFCALIAVYHGLAYERRAERLSLIARQQKRQRRGKAWWKLSWIPFYFGVRAYVRRMESAQGRPRRSK